MKLDVGPHIWNSLPNQIKEDTDYTKVQGIY